jgi:hypothetical protein
MSSPEKKSSRKKRRGEETEDEEVIKPSSQPRQSAEANLLLADALSMVQTGPAGVTSPKKKKKHQRRPSYDGKLGQM